MRPDAGDNAMEKKKIGILAGAAAAILLLVLAVYFYGQGDHNGPSLTLVESLQVGYGQKVGLYDVVRAVSDESDYRIAFTAGGEIAADGRSTVFPRSGSASVEVTAQDVHGNKSVKTLDIQVLDTKPPVLQINDLEIDLGDQVNYLSGVSARDEMDGDLTASIQVDTSKVVDSIPGVYPVIYSVSDRSGNQATLSAALTIRSPEARAIHLDRQTLVLDGNGHYALTAQVEPSAWRGKIQWESSDRTVAVVHNGLITWTGRGACTITATAGDVSAQCEVECGAVTVSSIKITRGNMELNYRESDRLYVSVIPSNWSGDVVWSSSDTSVATVNSSGGVLWIGEGNCTITATADGHSSSCKVRCNEPQVESVEIVEESIVLDAHQSYQIIPIVLPEAWPGEVVWSSSDEGVATVSDGLIRWVSDGTCTVTARAGSFSDSVVVTCNKTFLDDLYDELFGDEDEEEQDAPGEDGGQGDQSDGNDQGGGDNSQE